MSRTPIPGHVSSVRAAEESHSQKRIKSTIKDANKKHYDPRTGLIQNGPSEMGSTAISHLNTGNGNNNGNNGMMMGYNNNNNGGSPITHQGRTSNNYSISQQYSSAQVSESGEKTSMINAKLNIPLSESQSNIPTQNKPQLDKLSRSKSLKAPTQTSQGLMCAFNSVAMIAVPEVKRNNSSPPGKESGYSSSSNNNIDKTINTKSPILVKRSSIKSSNSDSLNLNHSHSSSKDPSPFDSEDNHLMDSPRGSSGFVNITGNSLRPMKDSPYDRIIKPIKGKK